LTSCAEVDFSSDEGVQGLAAHIDALLGQDSQETQGIRHQGKALCCAQGRQRRSPHGYVTVRDAKDIEALARTGLSQGLTDSKKSALQASTCCCKKAY
jgi:hypothetical protein